jgi:hypothetical protein
MCLTCLFLGALSCHDVNIQVQTPNFDGAISFFVRAAELFSQTYDGKDEVKEKAMAAGRFPPELT